jgi:hypothetical protein
VNLSRRQFGQLGLMAGATAFAGATPKFTFADAPLTAKQIVDQITSLMGPAWNPKSYRDTFKMGDPDTPVKGVASCFMATFDVLKRAQKKGLNFVITHEPTIWSDRDSIAPVENDPLYKAKLGFVNDNKMVIWRTHDSLHSMRPEPMTATENGKLGWDKYALPDKATVYKFPPTTLNDIVTQYVEKVPTGSVRVIGNPDMPVSSATQCGHAFGQNIAGLENYDCTISIEVREWETCEYGRDLLASGAKGAMIIGSHESGEENMMNWFTGWFHQRFPAIPAEFVPTTDRLWTL